MSIFSRYMLALTLSVRNRNTSISSKKLCNIFDEPELLFLIKKNPFWKIPIKMSPVLPHQAASNKVISVIYFSFYLYLYWEV